MKKLFVLLLTLAVTLGLLGCGQKASPWEEQYDLGMRYLSEGNYEEAILAFNAAIEIDPKRPEAYVGLAKAYTAQGDPEKAAEALTRAEEACGESDVLSAAWEELGLLPGDGGEPAGPAEGTIDVVTHRIVYDAYGGIMSDAAYFYNEQGYLYREEDSDGDGTEVTTWEYDDDSGHCWEIPDRRFFDSDAEWEEEKQERWHEPGALPWRSVGWGTKFVWADPAPGDDCPETVYSSDWGDGDKWSYAVYTYDEEGKAVSVVTYGIDGQINGTASFEWDSINLTA